MKIHTQDSVPIPTVRAIVPQQARVPVSHKGIKRLTSSTELDAQYVSPHQIPKRPHLQEEDMPVAFCRECHVELQMRKLQWKKEVSGSSKQLHLKEQITGIPGTSGAAGDLKKVDKP